LSEIEGLPANGCGPCNAAWCRGSHAIPGYAAGVASDDTNGYATPIRLAPTHAVFRPDEHISQIAGAYALDAVELSTSTFHLTLDFTEESIASLEQALARLHDSIAEKRPQEDRIWTLAKAFGSYLGEVFRKAHGGEWGMVTLGESTFPGMRCEAKDLTFSPWIRAHQRILRGAGDNIWHYYRGLCNQ